MLAMFFRDGSMPIDSRYLVAYSCSRIFRKYGSVRSMRYYNMAKLPQ